MHCLSAAHWHTALHSGMSCYLDHMYAEPPAAVATICTDLRKQYTNHSQLCDCVCLTSTVFHTTSENIFKGNILEIGWILKVERICD